MSGVVSFPLICRFNVACMVVGSGQVIWTTSDCALAGRL